MNSKIYIVATSAHSLINFRYDLILDLKKKGYDIITISQDYNKEVKQKLSKIGVKFFFYGTKKNKFINELNSIFQIKKILKNNKFNYKLISYTLRANIFSGILSLLDKKMQHIPMITGVGNIFISKKDSLFNFLNYYLFKLLLKFAFIRAKKIIFQNKNDRIFFLNNISNKKSIIVPGSGVNINKFKKLDLPKKIGFLMISRLIKNKGIENYLEMTENFKNEKNVNFFFVYKKFNFFSLKLNKKLNKKNYPNVSFLSWRSNVTDLFKKTSVYVLPSRREGMSRSILEAMACGRAIITTNVPGCKETVIENYNGNKIKYGDTKGLVKSIKNLLDQKNLIKKFGVNSRKMAIERFDVNVVNKKILNLIENC